MRSIGVTILGVMGGVWWLAGLATAGTLSPIAVVPGMAAAALLIAVARTMTDDSIDEAERRRRGKIVMWASAIEGIAIFISNTVLMNVGAASYILCGMAVIVGLHFVPMGRGFRAPIYYVMAATLVVVGWVGCLVADPGSRNLVVSLGSAVTLWMSGAWVAMRARATRIA